MTVAAVVLAAGGGRRYGMPKALVEYEGSPRNVWPVRLVGATPYGATVRCELDGEVPLVADVTATAVAELGLVPGAPVWASVKASDIAVYAR